MKKRILIAGYYGYNNTGDEAILSTLLYGLRKIEMSLHICVLSGNPEKTRKMHRVKAINNSDIQAIINQARKSDYLVVGGGGVFNDYWGVDKDAILTGSHGGIPFYSCLPLLGTLLNKPVLLYAVGVGPLFSEDGRDLTQLIFEMATAATVRDRDSQQLLISLGIPKRKVHVTIDSAFNLKADSKNARQLLARYSINPSKPLIGICLRNWTFSRARNNWQDEMANALDKFNVQNFCTLLFIPFQNLPSNSLTDDISAAQSVINKMNQRESVILLEAEDSPQIVMGILSQCDMVLGMRYHSIVFAAHENIPVVGFAYDGKVTQLMKSLNLEEFVVESTKMTSKTILARMNLAWRNRQLTKMILPRTIGSIQFAIQTNRRILEKFLRIENFKSRKTQKVDKFIKEISLNQARLLDESQKVIIKKEDWLLQDLGTNQNLIEQIQEKNEAITGFINQIDRQTSSRAWKLMGLLWTIRKILIPNGSKREELLFKTLNQVIRFKKSLFRFILQVPPGFQNRLMEEDNTLVTLYSNESMLWPNYAPRKLLSSIQKKEVLKKSLIACAKNEEDNVSKWLESIYNQTEKPDEIVVVLAGSTDATFEILKQKAINSSIPLKVLTNPTANIAQARNQAIANTKYSLIAVLDFGATPDSEWLAKLITPFHDDPETCMAAGIYRVVNKDGRQSFLSKLWEWNRPGKIIPQNYLPPGGSTLFKKEIWKEVGGYPEWLTLTGEDTYFDLEIKKLGGKWAFVPDAIVNWHSPERLIPYLKKLHNWAIGDGESGIRGKYYWNSARRLILLWIGVTVLLSVPITFLFIPPVTDANIQKYLLFVLLCGLFGIWAWARRNDLPPFLLFYRILGEISQILGYFEGVRRRTIVDARRFEQVKGLVFLLSGVPIEDTGGGARGTQLAHEFLRRNFVVVYINRYPSFERIKLEIKIVHPNLIAQSIDLFNLETFKKNHLGLFSSKKILTIIEHPMKEFVPILDKLNRIEGVSIYDLVDDWDTSLGGNWYSSNVEREIITSSQLLVATLPVLAERLEAESGRKPLVLPNAVNHRLFDPDLTYGRPSDLPANKKIVIYVGALWGDWFDWDLLTRMAERYPQEAFILVGDYRGGREYLPANIHFLGLKAQRDLPAYLAHSDVAVIPWRVDQISRATSPLKVYEYLAMRLPVVTPRLEPLRQVPGVFQALDLEEFITLVGKVSRNSIVEKTISDFIKKNNWTTRVDLLLEYINKAQVSNPK